MAFPVKYKHRFISWSKQIFVLKHKHFNLINKIWRIEFVQSFIERCYWATKKTKRLKLQSHNGLFICPVAYCESEPYRSKRGCRKHVFTKHGWYYYFEEKTDIVKVFPEFTTRTNNYQLPKLVKNSNMPIFSKSWVV